VIDGAGIFNPNGSCHAGYVLQSNLFCNSIHLCKPDPLQLLQSNGNGFPLTGLAPLAKELGLDAERFQKCMDSSKYEARVQEDFMEGSKIGITGTPANILLHNLTGEAVLKVGALPLEAFKAEIDKMLK